LNFHPRAKPGSKLQNPEVNKEIEVGSDYVNISGHTSLLATLAIASVNNRSLSIGELLLVYEHVKKVSITTRGEAEETKKNSKFFYETAMSCHLT
jgi:hypothetical protein